MLDFISTDRLKRPMTLGRSFNPPNRPKVQEEETVNILEHNPPVIETFESPTHMNLSTSRISFNFSRPFRTPNEWRTNNNYIVNNNSNNSSSERNRLRLLLVELIIPLLQPVPLSSALDLQGLRRL